MAYIKVKLEHFIKKILQIVVKENRDYVLSLFFNWCKDDLKHTTTFL